MMIGTSCNRKRHCGGAVAKLLSLAATAAACLSSTLMVAAETTSASSASASASPTASSSLSSNPDGCITDYDSSAGVDYFPDKAVVEYATTFAVEYFPSYKVLTVIGLYSNSTYVLYQCGTPQPDLGDTAAVVQQYIEVPVTNVSTGTPDHIPRIELLGHRDSIVAYTGDTSFIGSPCVDALVENGTVVQAIVFDTVCSVDIVDNQALMNASVEVAFGDMLMTSYCENATMTYNGVEVLTFYESGDTVGLGQGEAIKLFSLFYNEEAKGNELFDEIETLWFCTKNNAQGCSVQLERSPTVAWFPYLPTDVSSAFYSPGSGYSAPSSGTYYEQAINNTGGTFVHCGEFEGLMTDEEMLACFADADVCVMAADYDDVVMFFDEEVLDQLSCVQNERVYDITLSGVNAWFEAITVEPHVLMEDMVVALHGDDYEFGIGSYDRLLLRNVFTEAGDSGTYYPDLGTCADPDAVVELQGECDLIVEFDTCEAGSVTADGQEGSPASKAAPHAAISALALALLAAAASLW